MCCQLPSSIIYRKPQNRLKSPNGLPAESIGGMGRPYACCPKAFYCPQCMRCHYSERHNPPQGLYNPCGGCYLWCHPTELCFFCVKKTDNFPYFSLVYVQYLYIPCFPLHIVVFKNGLPILLYFFLYKGLKLW